MIEKQHAAPGTRRWIILLFALATIVGGGLIALAQAYRPALLDWVTSDPSRMRGRTRILIGVLGVMTLAPLAATASWMWTLGTRVLREERFPPERTKVLQDMIVFRGAAARSRGLLFQILAATLLLLAILMAYILWRLAALA